MSWKEVLPLFESWKGKALRVMSLEHSPDAFDGVLSQVEGGGFLAIEADRSVGSDGTVVLSELSRADFQRIASADPEFEDCVVVFLPLGKNVMLQKYRS